MDAAPFIAVLIPVLLVAGGLVGLVGWLRARQRDTAARVAERTRHQDVVRSAPANCLGILSKGKRQNRGNGTLVLTSTRLIFEPLVGANRVDQPLDTIEVVDTVRSFLGKTLFRQLLRVEWRTPDGGTDSAAWVVSDLTGWLEALAQDAGSR